MLDELKATVAAIAVPGKGLLAADESTGTIEKRFKALNIACTEGSRRNYRELLFTTPHLSNFISGVILFDETLKQRTKEGQPFADYLQKNGIVPGIKVDKGLIPLAGSPDENITEGNKHKSSISLINEL